MVNQVHTTLLTDNAVMRRIEVADLGSLNTPRRWDREAATFFHFRDLIPRLKTLIGVVPYILVLIGVIGGGI